PDNDDLRGRLVRVAMDLMRFDDARQHLEEYLLKKTPEDGQLYRLLAVCQEARGEYNQARKSYERAIALAPTQIESYLRLASMQRKQLGQPGDQLMDDMVAANRDDFQAFLARARYRKEFGSLDDAAEDASRAQVLAPDDIEVLIVSSEITLAQGDADSAREF